MHPGSFCSVFAGLYKKAIGVENDALLFKPSSNGCASQRPAAGPGSRWPVLKTGWRDCVITVGLSVALCNDDGLKSTTIGRWRPPFEADYLFHEYRIGGVAIRRSFLYPFQRMACRQYHFSISFNMLGLPEDAPQGGESHRMPLPNRMSVIINNYQVRCS